MEPPAYVADLEERRRRVEAEPLPENVPALIAGAAVRYGDREVCVFFHEGGRLTYRELHARSSALADSLSRLDVVKGTRVGVMLPNGAAFPVTWVALAKLGAVIVPVNINYTGRELAYVLTDSGATHLVIDAACLAIYRAVDHDLTAIPNAHLIVHGEVAGEGGETWSNLVAGGDESFTPDTSVASDDLLNIQYTSGTTGFPKGCMLTHRYWLVLGKVVGAFDDPPLRRILVAQPFFYMDPQWLLLMAVYNGGTIYVAKRASARHFMDWVREHRIEYCLFPEIVFKQPESPLDAQNELRRVSIFGVRPDIHPALERRFDIVAREAFGMTEVGAALAMPAEATDMVGSGSCGLPVPFRECMVADAAGGPVPPGTVGELLVAGDGILLGYYAKPEANAQVFHGRWFRTGDLFRQDQRGFYYIVGRIKDMIRRSGENIAAREVEAVLRALPEIVEAAVVPVPDDLRKEEAKAYVVLNPGLTPGDVPPEKIFAHCFEGLARFKVPRYLAYRESLPKTPTEKIAKDRLIAESEDLRTNSFDRVDGIWRCAARTES